MHISYFALTQGTKIYDRCRLHERECHSTCCSMRIMRRDSLTTKTVKRMLISEKTIGHSSQQTILAWLTRIRHSKVPNHTIRPLPDSHIGHCFKEHVFGLLYRNIGCFLNHRRALDRERRYFSANSRETRSIEQSPPMSIQER